MALAVYRPTATMAPPLRLKRTALEAPLIPLRRQTSKPWAVQVEMAVPLDRLAAMGGLDPQVVAILRSRHRAQQALAARLASPSMALL